LADWFKITLSFLDTSKLNGGVEFDVKMDELEEAYHLFRSQYDYMFSRYKLESERGPQRRRTRLRQCVRFLDLHSPEPVDRPELFYRTITRCTIFNRGIL